MNYLEFTLGWAYNILAIVPATLFYKTVACFNVPKENQAIKFVTYVLSYVIIRTVVFAQDMTNVTLLLLFFLLVMLLGFKGTLSRRVGAVALLMPLIVTVSFVLEELGLYLYLLAGETVLADGLLHLFFGGVKILIWYGIYQLFKTRVTHARKFLSPTMWGIICAVSFGPLLGIIFIVIFSPSRAWLTFPVMAATALTALGTQYLIGYISDSAKKEIENKQLKLQEQYYLEMEKSQQEIRKLKHDMNNHLSVVGNYLEKNQVSEAEQYFKNLSTVYTGKTRTFCKNALLNNILNAKYEMAQRTETDCFFNIDISNLIGIDDISLCTLFANTLDNAIEATQKLATPEQRKITLKARYHQGYFSYEISNSTEERLIARNGQILTTKADKKNHGFGLANTKEVVANYDGTMEITQTENKFTLLIVITDV